jgi:hypothetical protein
MYDFTVQLQCAFTHSLSLPVHLKMHSTLITPSSAFSDEWVSKDIEETHIVVALQNRTCK